MKYVIVIGYKDGTEIKQATNNWLGMYQLMGTALINMDVIKVCVHIKP